MPEIAREMGSVQWVTSVNTLPSRARAGIGWSRRFRAQPSSSARYLSMSLSSAPHSMRACKGKQVPAKHEFADTESRILPYRLRFSGSSIPPVLMTSPSFWQNRAVGDIETRLATVQALISLNPA